MPAQPLSADQLSEAAKLKDLFREWQRSRKASGLPSSQEAAAELLGFGQSALAQYLNGKIPLNVDVAVKFSNLLGIAMGAFTPSLADQASRVVESLTSYAANDGPDLMFTVHGDSTTFTTLEVKRSGLPEKLQASVLLDAISLREALLIVKFRMANEEGKRMFETVANSAPRDELSIVHNEAKS